MVINSDGLTTVPNGMINDDEILVIEDDEDDAQAIIQVLKKHVTAKIRHIDNGKSAVEYLFFSESDNLKVIFLDLVLPFVHGVEILQKLKMEKIKSKIPVIILSSLKAEEYIKSFGLTADAYFSKHQIIEQDAGDLFNLLDTFLNTHEPHSV